MDLAAFFFGMKIALSLGLGVLAARMLRIPIRKLLTRLTPMKDRMAEQFLEKLSWRSTLVGMIITLVGSTLSWWLLHQGQKRWSGGKTGAPAQRLGIGWPTPPPTPAEVPLENLEPTPVEPLPAVELPVPPPRRSALASSDGWYWQLEAFATEANARNQWTYWQQRLRQPVRLGWLDDGIAPWKIVAGPFPSRDASKAFGRSSQLPGFARPGQQLTWPDAQ